MVFKAGTGTPYAGFSGRQSCGRPMDGLLKMFLPDG